jgi:hypothetical protein
MCVCVCVCVRARAFVCVRLGFRATDSSVSIKLVSCIISDINVSRSLSRSRARSLSRSRARALSLSLSRSLARSRARSLSSSLSRALSFSLPHSLSLYTHRRTRAILWRVSIYTRERILYKCFPLLQSMYENSSYMNLLYECVPFRRTHSISYKGTHSI